MKKFLTFRIAALLLICLGLTASCCRRSKSSHDDDVPISLSIASTGSKAVVDDKTGMIGQCFDGDNLKSGAGFGVYGYKKESSGTSIKLFDNFLVYPVEKLTSTAWTYTPKRYWDSNPVVSYQFIAYWPHISDEVSSNPYVSVPAPVGGDYADERKVLTIHNVPNWKLVDGTETDYMTAATSGKYRTSVQYEVAAFSSGTVPLSFRHILSQLIIKAYYIGNEHESNSGLGVKVNSIKLEKSDADEKVLSNTSSGNTVNVTDFSQKYYDKDAAPLTPTSPKTNMADECTLTLAQSVRIPYMDEITKEFTQGNTHPTGPQEVGRWLMVPHKWLNLNLSVNRTIGNTEAADSDPVPVTVGESNYSYVTQPGSTYTITLMIDVATGSITIGSIDIQDWIVQNTTHEVYNW